MAGIIFLIGMNLLTFIMMGYDKRQAMIKGWRIPESRLFLLAILGGAIGTFLGMYIFRHKTKHIAFRIVIPIFILIHVFISVKIFI